MNFANLKIGTRLILGYVVLLILSVAVATFGIHGMHQTNDSLHHIVEGNVQKTALLETMSTSVQTVSRVIRTIALLDDTAQIAIQHEKIPLARNQYNSASDALDNMPLDEKDRNYVAKIKEYRDAARAINNKFVELGKSDKRAAVTLLLNEAIPANNKWTDTLAEYAELQKQKNKQDEEEAAAAFTSARNLMIGLIIASLIVSGVIGKLTITSISDPLNEAVKIAQTVAAGDLTSRIEVRTSDETGQLLQALLDMNGNLSGIVAQVRSGSDTIASASSEVASGNLDLSSRTERQASSIEETVSSMEELTATVRQNAENARQADQLAQSASEIARKGGSVVAEVVNTMGSINESSKRIVDIIAVIDGIAFQTNILALNAAVEAARAGEQGRGFAVVASEVRNLAQRSAGAAKEIKELINASVEKVDAGSRLVDQAGATMNDVVESVRRVSEIISEITNAGHEQTAGIEQINQAITQMDESTQQNAALVEQSAAAAEALQDQANQLLHVVRNLKIEGMHVGAASSRIDKPIPGPAATAKTVKALMPNAPKKNQTVRAVNAQRFARVANQKSDDGQWDEF